jgi:hypothetical protein
MFTLPQMPTVPVLHCGVGIDWPWIGPVLACMLIAAVIGGFLGLLRASSGRTLASPGTTTSSRSAARLAARCARALHLPLRTPLHNCSPPQSF